ncbi:MAG: ABC transporter ATP-binding protein [Magnetococcales bacterium]|nr:ABC transporter ATP-binding protein [Magnetococcales bacterium]MBF0156234.1 ABC transporter ATP-binding protein [Magnetococcales bacterium]
MKPLLAWEGVHAAYGPVRALHGVSLSIRAGEIVALIGANGAGKSTLLMSLFGQPRVSRGRILFQGEEITSLAGHRLAHLGMALVPEGRRIFPAMTVMENLAMGAVTRGGRVDPGTLDKVMDLFPLLGERRGQRGGTLSGGEQQMLAIGRALMSRPRLLLLDEPSLGLAPLIIRQIFGILARIREEGGTIFLVEQNANQALRLADRGYVLANGEIRTEGRGGDLLTDPGIREAYLGGLAKPG